MRKVFKKIFAAGILMLLTFAAGLLCACSYTKTDEENEKITQGYTCVVTFDANGGVYDNNGRTSSVKVRIQPGTPVPRLKAASSGGSDSSETKSDWATAEPTKTNQKLLGWYEPQRDENGDILYEADGTTPVLSETAWNFSDKVESDLILFAKWQAYFYFQIIAVDSEGNQTPLDIYPLGDETTGKVGHVLYDSSVVSGEAERRPDRIQISYSGNTPLEFYENPECTTLFDLDFVHPGVNGEYTGDYPIYMKYLSGAFDFVSPESRPTLTPTSLWYVLEDTDYSDKAAVDALTRYTFTGVIYGNGHVISGIKFKSTAQNIKEGNWYSHAIFGVMGGVVTDVTFKDVLFTLEAPPISGTISDVQYVSFLASTFTENGLFDGVRLENCTIAFKNKEKCEEILLNEKSGYLWEEPIDEEQSSYIAKQSVTGTVTLSEDGDSGE